MSDSAMPYYQAGLRNKLCYEITFNDYEKVINATEKAASSDAMYKIRDIALEYESLPSQISQVESQLNTKLLLCSMTGFSDTDKF